MLVRRIAAVEALADPGAAAWSSIAAETVKLMPAPIGMQPSRYIVTKWRELDYGKVAALGVQGVHDGASIAFRLRWRDPTKNARRFENTDFADAAALLFPLSPNAPLFMGTQGHPVSLWYWRADYPDQVRTNVAAGIGTSRMIDDGAATARAEHDGEFWTVVLRRALRVETHASESAQFEPGQQLRTTFAVWDGGNMERAGIKAFAPDWVELAIEA